MAISHANCTHPRTPAGRSACRRMNGSISVPAVNPVRELAEAAGIVKPIKMTGPVARRMARQAMKAENARIQPRRSGARVSIDNSGCVQAALHTTGRCACTWHDTNHCYPNCTTHAA